MFHRAEHVPGAINLAIGQPDFATPRHIAEAAKRAIDRGQTRYTHGLGISELRRAIAHKARVQNGLAVDEACVAVTVGAMEGLMLSLLATLDPGDEVLVPDPGYTNFMGQVLMAGATPVFYPLQPPDFQVDVAGMRELVTEKTKVLMLCTPANPTGAVLTRRNLEAVAELAREHDLVVLSDETYEALVYDGTHVSIGSLPGMVERVVTISSFSKTYAMTGWRVGYVVAVPELIDTLGVLQENTASCASSVSQYAALAALEGPQDCVDQMRSAYNERRHYIVPALNELDGVDCAPARGAFYAFADISALDRSADAFADWLLERARVAVVPGTAFNSRGEGFVRISYAASLETLHDAMERVGTALQSGQQVAPYGAGRDAALD